MTVGTRTCCRNKEGNYSVEENVETNTYTQDHRNKARQARFPRKPKLERERITYV